MNFIYLIFGRETTENIYWREVLPTLKSNYVKLERSKFGEIIQRQN